MNLDLLKGMLTVGGKFVPILLGILAEVGPAVATLGPDFARLVDDLNKTLQDAQDIFQKLSANVTAAASNPAPVIPPPPPPPAPAPAA